LHIAEKVGYALRMCGLVGVNGYFDCPNTHKEHENHDEGEDEGDGEVKVFRGLWAVSKRDHKDGDKGGKVKLS
jgi:hypothetical protein